MKKRVIYFSTFVLIFLFLNGERFPFFFQDVYNSFFRTVIEEKRYLLFLRGLKATLILSFGSLILSTVLGFFLFYLQHTKKKIFSFLSLFFVRLLQGVPVTVLLLIFYFVLFGRSNLPAIWVAILAFSLYYSSYISEIFKGAFKSIHQNQIDASYALGFSKMQTFQYILFPQLCSFILPVYKNEAVALIKSTSIAGYISIMDLTKASDIIRNRTYEAFFPLLFTALIYFILCSSVSKMLDLFYRRINLRRNFQS